MTEELGKQEALEWFNKATEPIDIDQMGRYGAFMDAWGAFERGAHPGAWKNWITRVVRDCGGQSVRRPSGLLVSKMKPAEWPGEKELAKAPPEEGTNLRYIDAGKVLSEQRKNTESCPYGPPMVAACQEFTRVKGAALLHGATEAEAIEIGKQAVRDQYVEWERQGRPTPAEFEVAP